MGGKILIADDVATNRIVLKVKLASAFYETIQASSGRETLALARSTRPDLILLDVEMPDLSGIDVCRRLKADPATSDIPVVMVTAFRDMERKMASLEAGADEVFWKPLDEVVLLARLRSILRAREMAEELWRRQGTACDLGLAEPAATFTRHSKVALLSNDRGRRETCLRELRPYLSDQLTGMEPESALSDFAAGGAPDVFLLGADLAAAGDGLRLISELRSRAATRHAAICVMLPVGARDLAAMALDLGASDLIEADAEASEIALRLRIQCSRKCQSDRLRDSLENRLRLAMVDSLTGLYNRRYAMAHLGRIAERATLSGQNFAVMILDLDRFKAINDTHGHAAGDAVLVEVAARLGEVLRPADLLARIGGEEFLIVLPDADLGRARSVAERLRRIIGETPVALPHDGAAVTVTSSIGLAIGNAPATAGLGVDALLHSADMALLYAKQDGRNQVIVGQNAA